MQIKFSILIEELSNYQIKVYKFRDINLSSFKLLEDNIKNDIIYLADITDFIALPDKDEGTFIVTDPYNIIDDLELNGNFNLIRITETMEQTSVINILNEIFLKYWQFENNLLRYINIEKPIKEILDYIKSSVNLDLCINDFNGNVVITNTEDIDKKIKSYTFRIKNKSIGSITLLNNGVNSKEYQLSMFYSIVDMLGSKLEKNFKEVIDANQRLANIIFENMINERKLTNDDYKNLSLLGWKKELNYNLILIENLSLNLGKEINSLIESSYPNEAIFIKFKNNHIILLNTNIAEKDIFISELKHILKNQINLKAIISSDFRNLDDLNTHYTLLANIIVNLENGFFDYSKDKIDLLIKSNLINENFINKEIMKLKEYDKKNDEELLETLYVYLACERSYVKTSELLNLHRNTIVYRINKIEGIINLDLDSIHGRLQILLSSLIISNDLLKYK